MKHKIILVLVSVFLAFAILCVSLSVTSVRVTGNRTYTAEEIEQLVFPTRMSRNSVACMIRGLMESARPGGCAGRARRPRAALRRGGEIPL